MAGIFKYAGVDLSTLGTAFEVMDGGKSFPPVRGHNLLIPYQHGRRAVAKYYDERAVSLVGQLLASSGLTFDSWVDQLKALFPLISGEQRFEMQWPNGSWRYLMAEVRSILLPLEGAREPIAAKCSIELVASDPFWYGSALECSQPRQAWTLDSGVVLDDGAHWLDVTSQYFARQLTSQVTIVEASNAGDVYTRKPVFSLSGKMTNPKITNLRNGYSVQVLLGITPPWQDLVIDCGAQQIYVSGTLYGNDKVALGAGQTDWMRLEAGENSLRVDLGAATSVAYRAQYSPAYL